MNPLRSDTPGVPLTWPDGLRSEVDAIRARYPDARAAVLPLLWLVQDTFGHVSPQGEELVARTLSSRPGSPPVPLAHVRATASFYTLLKKAPQGRWRIQVCRTLCCALAGAPTLLSHLERVLAIQDGQTTPDGQFTLESVECLASCGSGPVVQVNEDLFFERMTPQKVDALLEALRRGDPLPPRPEADEWTWTR